MKTFSLLLACLLATPAIAQSPRERAPERQRRVERPAEAPQASRRKASDNAMRERVLSLFDSNQDGKLDAGEAQAARSAIARRRGQRSGESAQKRDGAQREERRAAAAKRGAQRERQATDRRGERRNRFRRRIQEARSNRQGAQKNDAKRRPSRAPVRRPLRRPVRRSTQRRSR